MTSAPHIRSSVDKYLMGLRLNDASRIVALFSTTPTVEDPIGTEPKIGVEAIEDFYGQPRGISEVERLGPITVSGRHAGFQFRIVLEVDGTETEIVITEFLRFDDAGKIDSMTAAPDFEPIGTPCGKVY